MGLRVKLVPLLNLELLKQCSSYPAIMSLATAGLEVSPSLPYLQYFT